MERHNSVSPFFILIFTFTIYSGATLGGVKDSNFAVARDGDTYIVYDYATGNVTRDMTRAEVNAALGRYRNSKNAATSEVTAEENSKNTNASENLSSDNALAVDNNAFDPFTNEKMRENAKKSCGWIRLPILPAMNFRAKSLVL